MATVLINLKDIFASGFARTVIFTPASTPFVDGQSLVVSETRQTTTDTDGKATIELEPGSYTVTFGVFGSRDVITIGVPDDDQEYQFSELINAGTSIPVPPVYQGPEGPQGPIGPEGQQGPEGPQGPKGDTPTKEDLGLDEVDNTSDANKPISIATQEALDGKAPAAFVFPATGAVLRTVDSKLKDESASVKDFGAKGDGETDDTAAIQAALDQQTHKTILFPAGTYKISDELIIKGEGRILLGESPSSVTILQSSNSKNALVCSTSSAPNELVIRNLTIAGNGTSANSNAAFRSRNEAASFFMTSVMIDNCYINRFAVGLDCAQLPRLYVVKTIITAITCCKFNKVDTFLFHNFRGVGVRLNTDSKIFEIAGGSFTGKVSMAELGSVGHIADVQQGILELDHCNIEDVTGDYVNRIGYLGRLTVNNSRINVVSGSSSRVVFRTTTDGSTSGTLIIGPYNNITAPSWRMIESVGSPLAGIYNFSQNSYPISFVASSGDSVAMTVPAWSVPVKTGTTAFNTPSAGNLGWTQLFLPWTGTTGHQAKSTPLHYGWNAESGVFSRQALSNDVLMRVLNNSGATVVGNAGTDETNIYSYSIPAYTLQNNGDKIKFEAFGLTAANGNNKRLRLALASTDLFDTGTITPSGKSWSVEATILRTTAAAARISVRVLSDGSEIGTFCKTVAFSASNWTSAITLALKGTGAASNDVVLHGAITTWIKSDYAY